MSETMIDYNGIGLAAPQVHISKRIIIFRNPDNDEKERIQITPLINPVFKPLSDEKEDDWEGCLSIPGFYEEVVRPLKVEINFQNLEGENKRRGLCNTS